MKDDHEYRINSLEKQIKAAFEAGVSVDKVILNGIPVSRTADATIFLTNKKQLMVFIEAKSNMLLGDVKKAVSRMGLKAEMYYPPKGRVNYFDEVGEEKFSSVFPGRKIVSGDDIEFYKTLASYNPALVLIREVRNGEIYQYDSDARGNWRLALRFAYRRIRTS